MCQSVQDLGPPPGCGTVGMKRRGRDSAVPAPSGVRARCRLPPATPASGCLHGVGSTAGSNVTYCTSSMARANASGSSRQVPAWVQVVCRKVPPIAALLQSAQAWSSLTSPFTCLQGAYFQSVAGMDVECPALAAVTRASAPQARAPTPVQLTEPWSLLT